MQLPVKWVAWAVIVMFLLLSGGSAGGNAIAALINQNVPTADSPKIEGLESKIAGIDTKVDAFVVALTDLKIAVNQLSDRPPPPWFQVKVEQMSAQIDKLSATVQQLQLDLVRSQVAP